LLDSPANRVHAPSGNRDRLAPRIESNRTTVARSIDPKVTERAGFKSYKNLTFSLPKNRFYATNIKANLSVHPQLK